MGNTHSPDSRYFGAHPGQAILVLAMLIVSFATAQPIQPADAGAFPLRQRIALIDNDLNTLVQSLRSQKASTEEKAGIRRRFDALTAEKQKLEAELKDVEFHKNSPLVQFHAPDPEMK